MKLLNRSDQSIKESLPALCEGEQCEAPATMVTAPDVRGRLQ